MGSSANNFNYKESDGGVKFLFLGGAAVGKTSLIARILNKPFPKSYNKTLLFDIHTVKIGPKTIRLWDLTSDLVKIKSDIKQYIFKNTDAVFIVIDASSKTSLIDADNWIKLLYNNKIPVEKITLLVNKADSLDLVVNQNCLDTFVSLGGCSNWYWTVSHKQLRDYCPSRGKIDNQDNPLDIVFRKYREIRLISPCIF